jgi:MoxR-vWA-beta-propeller ternary system domain bpX6
MKSELFRGTISAHGFVFDLCVLGDDETQQRVMGLLTPATTLHMIDAKRCVMIFDRPQLVRVQLALGMPLVRVKGQLVNASFAPPDLPGNLLVLHQGEWSSHDIASLTSVDPSAWLDLSSLPIVNLVPLQTAAPAAVTVIDPIAAPHADLRQTANIRGRSARMARRRNSLIHAAQQTTQRSRAQRWLKLGKPMLSGQPSAPSEPKSQALQSFFASLFLQSAISRRLQRKHAEYLEDLRKQLDQGNWEEALRNAISVAESKSLGTAIGVPTRRTSLSPSTSQRLATRSVGYGAATHIDLTTRYRKAASELEAGGHIERAAFVHVDLLGVPLEAIALLERHNRWQLAAEIAEGHQLDPALRIELWWNAQRRDLAVLIARRHGAFAAAISRNETTNVRMANELRIEWVSYLLGAGATRLAVEAAWPQLHLRPMVAEAIDRAITSGAGDAYALRAYQLSLTPSAENRAEILGCLAAEAELDVQDVTQLVLTLGHVKCNDPAVDAEVAAAATRALLRLAADQRNDRELGGALKRLSTRIDPVLLADLPSLAAHYASQPGGRESGHPTQPIEARIEAPGLKIVHDAAVLPNGTAIVALGESGVQLITSSGGIAAHWHVPTHRLVVADHGARVLLLTQRGHIVDVHQLNLVTRQVQRWTTLRLLKWADTFDGATWVVVDEDGIAALDTLSDEPRALWRELSAADGVVSLQRSATHLSAGIHHDVPGPEVWEWDLPAFTLRHRRAWAGAHQHVTSSGDPIAVSIYPDALELSGRGGSVSLAGRTLAVMTAGMCLAVQVDEGPKEPSVVWIYCGSVQTPSARIRTTRTPVSLRQVGTVVTLHDGTGQMFAFDPARPGWGRSHRLTV